MNSWTQEVKCGEVKSLPVEVIPAVLFSWTSTWSPLNFFSRVLCFASRSDPVSSAQGILGKHKPGQAAPGQLMGSLLCRCQREDELYFASATHHRVTFFHPNVDFGSLEAQRDPIRRPTVLSRHCSDALPVGGQVTADVRQMMMLITAEGSGVQLIYSERIFNSSHR